MCIDCSHYVICTHWYIVLIVQDICTSCTRNEESTIFASSLCKFYTSCARGLFNREGAMAMHLHILFTLQILCAKFCTSCAICKGTFQQRGCDGNEFPHIVYIANSLCKICTSCTICKGTFQQRGCDGNAFAHIVYIANNLCKVLHKLCNMQGDHSTERV